MAILHSYVKLPEGRLWKHFQGLAALTGGQDQSLIMRAAPCECRKSHEMGAVPNPLLITAGGRLMILEQVRFGVSSLTAKKILFLKAITTGT